ncbi:hypothetical protein HDV06_004315 [Boothiomyces sp. JEL0866]|nr:hypothetical protein HDV06_004315 [Boothiomyces sp. JEL0866]
MALSTLDKSEVSYKSVNLKDGWIVLFKIEKRMALTDKRYKYKKVTRSFGRIGYPFKGFEAVEITYMGNENDVIKSSYSYEITRRPLCPIDPFINYKPQEEWYTQFSNLMSIARQG